MADEARVTSFLAIRKSSTDGSLQYQSQPSSFVADVTGNKGPVPGALTVTTTGVNVDLSGLTYKGLCRVMNLEADSATTYVLMGMYDGTNFFPLMEILPGETFVFRLYRYLGGEFTGTGTNADTDTLRMMSMGGASSNVVVEAFER
jgi:hypothetical protein